MKLSDIIDTGVLEDEIRSGYVSRRYHPEFPQLAILNYTDKCQFDQHWNDVTLQTRGLIYNTDTGEVGARALSKFFNHSDTARIGDLSPDTPVMGVFDKLDGSLAVTYERPDGELAIATRGSFTSEQALHATEWLNTPGGWHALLREELRTDVECGSTPVGEIIYPDNRIVLDYGDRDEVVFFGSVEMETGRFVPDWDLEPAEFREDWTLRDVFTLPPRPNAEGYVIWLDPFTAIKWKQEDYLALHRIVSNLTEKEVWRQLKAGTFGGFVVALPDEFHQWATDTAQPLQIAASSIENRVFVWHRILVAEGFETRKEQALWIQENVEADYRGLVFGLLDNRDISEGIWKLLEPKGGEKP